MIKAIIIDDEQLARDIIRKFLADQDDIEVVDECANGYEGIKAIQKHSPDLIFLDIQMPKINGFEMLELLDEKPAVIFSTAFDEYALKAFELSAADYLLKPYAKSRFLEALQKVRAMLNKDDNKKIIQEQSEKTLEAVSQQRSIDRIVIRSGVNIDIIPVGEVKYIHAQDDYVDIHTGSKKYLKQKTMKYYEECLPEIFVRVHRSYIININALNKIEPYSKDAYVAILKSGETISVSKTGYKKLKDHLQI